ncbi:phosphoglucomutase-1 [Trichonephila inaurata madagascariensis]|uniref:Phosphoglucomutase-1 n=1 Tax=Trichonephila inaurata madagascariensis TaxID=2747483 RepID=A0A8X6IJ76_9ARAC|nr:phosphoglucomutase-1 [Trichonephila inaurata madagascariensis]
MNFVGLDLAFADQVVSVTTTALTGPLVKEIFINHLGISEKRILNEIPLDDFGGSSTDPNPSTCESFLDLEKSKRCDFGAVISPDGSRCLIVGKDGLTVCGSDSLAVIANQSRCIPFFQENPLQVVIRSVCTSTALDDKCADKDGVWTVLFWLSLMFHRQKSINEIVMEHWQKFGRNVCGRLDFKEINSANLDALMAFFRETYSLRFNKIKVVTLGGVRYSDPFGLDSNHQANEVQKSDSSVVFDIENYVYPYGFIRKSILRSDTHQNDACGIQKRIILLKARLRNIHGVLYMCKYHMFDRRLDETTSHIFSHPQMYRISLTKKAMLVLRRSESAHGTCTLRFYLEVRLDPEDERLTSDRKVTSILSNILIESIRFRSTSQT